MTPFGIACVIGGIVFLSLLTMSYPGIVIPGYVVIIAIIVVRQMVKRAKNRRSEEEARRDAERKRLDAERGRLDAERKRYLDDQRGIFEGLYAASSDSVRLYGEIPHLLKRAADALVRAEGHFAEHAYAPYWDSIEESVNLLARVSSHLAAISSNYSKYLSFAPQLKEAEVPPWLVDMESLNGFTLAEDIADALRSSVSSAQKDFQFASIFEARRTNQLLVTGFASLQSAIFSMSKVLSEQLGSLESVLSEKLGSLESAMAHNTNTLNSSLAAVSASVASSTSQLAGLQEKNNDLLRASARREKESIAVLNNIRWKM